MLSPNYRAAVRSYRRPLIWFAAIPVALWIVSVGIAAAFAGQMQAFLGGAQTNVHDEALRQLQMMAHLGTFRLLIVPSGVLLIWIGATLNVHLKEMLGNANSRLIPGLHRAHLAVAALVIASFTLAAPLATVSCVELGMSSATVVALSLALFTSAAFLVHWFPYALPPVFAIACFFFGLASNGSRSWWSMSPTTLWALIIVSLGGLAFVGLRLARFHEGMFEYYRRWKAEPRDSRGFPWFFPLAEVRIGRRTGSPAVDTLLGRALRWHAAWQTMWVAVGLGLFMGGMLGAMALLKPISSGIVNPCQMVGVLAILIWRRNGTSVAGSWEAAAFSLCCLPVLFGAAVWPCRTSFVFLAYSAPFGVMGSFFLTPLRLSGSELVCAAASILIVGLFLTRASYLRWLNHDAVPGPPLFGSRESEGAWDRGVAMQRLRKR